MRPEPWRGPAVRGCCCRWAQRVCDPRAVRRPASTRSPASPRTPPSPSRRPASTRRPASPRAPANPPGRPAFTRRPASPRTSTSPPKETGLHKEPGADELYEETGFHKEPSKPKDVNKPLKPPDVTDDHKNTLGIADVCNGTQFWEDTNDHSYREKRKFALNKIFEAWLTWMIEEAEAASEESSDAETNRQ